LSGLHNDIPNGYIPISKKVFIQIEISYIFYRWSSTRKTTSVLTLRRQL